MTRRGLFRLAYGLPLLASMGIKKPKLKREYLPIETLNVKDAIIGPIHGFTAKDQIVIPASTPGPTKGYIYQLYVDENKRVIYKRGMGWKK